MKNGPPEYSLVRNHLLVRKVGDEVIVYDSKTHTAHCLNDSAASVWQLCEAHKSVPEICAALEQPDEQQVWAILSELRSAGLLVNPPPGIDDNRLSRRDLVKRAGAGIALAAPFLTSIIVPPPASAVTPHPPRRPPRRN